MLVCVRTSVSVFVHKQTQAHSCICELALACHLVNTDLWLFDPVGYVMVSETRADVCSPSLHVPNKTKGWGPSCVSLLNSSWSVFVHIGFLLKWQSSFSVHLVCSCFGVKDWRPAKKSLSLQWTVKLLLVVCVVIQDSSFLSSNVRNVVSNYIETF